MKALASLEPIVEEDIGSIYRVYFWERPAAGYAWNLDAWVLTEAAVTEVLEWVGKRARGRPTQVLVRGLLATESAWVPLMGSSPNEGTPTPAEGFSVSPDPPG